MRILVTGAAGFIGMNLCKFLMQAGHIVIGIDDIQTVDKDAVLKFARLTHLQELECKGSFSYAHVDLAEVEQVAAFFQRYEDHDFDVVYHLAATPGIHDSQYHPHTYTQNNIVAFGNILEACRHNSVEHLIFASSSSVYGAQSNHTENAQPMPLNYYAATKLCNEVMAETYSRQYDMRITAARLFSVYGPWGRPDMAPWIFMDSLVNRKEIRLAGDGQVMRDFTFIDDAVTMLDALNFDLTDDKLLEEASKFQVYNIGASFPVTLFNFLSVMMEVTGLKADIKSKFLPQSEVFRTDANMSKFELLVCNPPQTDLKVGISRFVEWYQNYHKE